MFTSKDNHNLKIRINNLSIWKSLKQIYVLSFLTIYFNSKICMPTLWGPRRLHYHFDSLCPARPYPELQSARVWERKWQCNAFKIFLRFWKTWIKLCLHRKPIFLCKELSEFPAASGKLHHGCHQRAAAEDRQLPLQTNGEEHKDRRRDSNTPCNRVCRSDGTREQHSKVDHWRLGGQISAAAGAAGDRTHAHHSKHRHSAVESKFPTAGNIWPGVGWASC